MFLFYKTTTFRVRNKKETRYCYNEEERKRCHRFFGKKHPEITRFKRAGEISPDEFKYFIGDDIRLEPVLMSKSKSIEEILTFYMEKTHLNVRVLL